MKRAKCAFTLVELLVVIAIIGILVALLLPAVQQAREAARRTQCTNHLKQLGLGILNFETDKRRLPAGRDSTNTSGVSWAFELLPYVEERAIFDAYDPSVRVDDLANRMAMATPVSIMYCPSRRAPAADRDFPNNERPARIRNAAAGGDFASNAGIDAMVNVNPDGAVDKSIAGAMYTDSRVKIRQVTDGTSKTLAAGERNLPTLNRTVGPRLLHHFLGDTAFFAADNPRTILGGTMGGLANGSEEPCGGGIRDECSFRFGGEHSGIILFVFLDGHVQSISDSVATEVVTPLSAIADGLVSDL